MAKAMPGAGNAAPGPKVVAICGTAGSSRAEIMQQPDDVELWGLNMSYTWMPRWDRWFEVHDHATHGYAFPPEHLEWLAAADVPVYMHHARDDVPSSITYPIEEVTEHGALRANLTSTIVYMMALAIHEQAREIRLLGVNMATDSEYGYQRAACEYWIGVAEGRGIKIYLPSSCPLTKAPRYGSDPPASDLARGLMDLREQVKLQLEQAKDKALENIKNQITEYDKLEYTCNGALQVLDRLSERGGTQ
jgi:hypothetical protein